MNLYFPERTILLVGGVPGSGKSRMLSRTVVLPRQRVDIVVADDIRGAVQAEMNYEREAYIPEAIPEARDRFFRRIDRDAEQGMSIIVEASYLTEKSQTEMIDWAALHNYSLYMLFVEASYLECVRGVRDRNRPWTGGEQLLSEKYHQWVAFKSRLSFNGPPKSVCGVTVIYREEETGGLFFA